MLLNKIKRYKALHSYYNNFFKGEIGNNLEAFKTAKFYQDNKLFPEQDDITHLKAAMSWLARAQDACNGKGVSAFFYMNNGWDVAYPETSGYIIATFLEYARIYEDVSFYERAIQIGDWEIEIQTNGGGVLSNPKNSHVRVFNTGQVMLGWCTLYELTKENKYLEAACKAADFLCNCQEENGTWIQNTYCGPRTYHARIDWALLRVYLHTGNNVYLQAAMKNLQWVIEQQNANGWFENCGFHNDNPIMHVIVYTLRGLLESNALNIDEVKNLGILEKIIKTAGKLNEYIVNTPLRGLTGLIPTSFQNNWITADAHSCLTGNAQYAVFLYRLSQLTQDNSYALIADSIVSTLKRNQNLSTSAAFKNICGAIPGSYPFYHGYCANSFPNWATKFFADAVLMKNNFKEGLVIKA
jgi:uncharacterized protein YyaL (SSP411 family)